MRAGIVLMALVGLAGCGSYNEVNQGWQGPTSPAESGQHGAMGDQDGSASEHAIQPLGEPLTNGNTDPTMEMSGNIAAQGNYSKAEQQRQGR